METIYISKNNLDREYKQTSLMLKKVKESGFLVIAVDYDGTVIDRYDNKHKSLSRVIELAHKVTQKGIQFAFISGRDTTLEMELREIVPDFCRANNTTLTIWRSGGNGMNLHKVSYGKDIKDIKSETIYSNSLNEALLKISLQIYDDLKVQPDKKSQGFFMSFLNKNLPEQLVPKQYLHLAKRYKGKIFAESVKITFVLPTDQREQKRYVEILRKKLSPYGLNVGWGRIPFADVSRELKIKGKIIDGKLLMIKNLIEKLKITKKQLVTFGDAPNDNNQGLLSFPYSFTNDASVVKKGLDSPPYILQVNGSPVESVYKAIAYLID